MAKHNLSDRELEVARLGAAGKSATEIAHALGLSPKTAKLHLHHIYGKLGISGPRAGMLLAAQAKELLGK